jgi:hypothetical protein
VTLDLFDDLFDDPGLDRVLASGLSDLAPEVDSADVALAELRPLFRQARRRRRIAQLTGALAAVFVVGGAVALAEAPSARRSHVTVESPRRIETTATTPKRAAKPKPATKTPKPTHATTPPVRVVPSAPSSTTGAPPHIVVVPTTAPVPAATTTPKPTAPPATAPALPVPVRYTSRFGSILVRFDHGRMTLVSVAPEPGYRKHVATNTPQHIDVRFSRDGQRSEIELLVVGDKVVRAHDEESWSPWRGVSAVSSVSKSHGKHRLNSPVNPPQGREASAPIAHPGGPGTAKPDPRTSA